MKICPRCEFQNPDTTSSCLSCGFEFKLRCQKCGSWRVDDRRRLCLDCHSSSVDRPDADKYSKLGEEFDERVGEMAGKMTESFGRGENPMAKPGEVLGPLGDLIKGAVRGEVQEKVEDVKVQLDPEWRAKGAVHGVKFQIYNKLLVGVIAGFAGLGCLIALALGLGSENLPYVAIGAIIFGVLFIRPLLDRILKPKFFSPS